MLLPEDLQLLQNTFLLQGCNEDETESLLSRCACRMETYENHDTLFSPEQFQRELGIVMSGRIRVSKGEQLVVSELTAGDLFGAAALFNTHTAYATTLTARTRCRVLYLTQREVQGLIDRSRLVRWNYIRYLSQRICFLSDKVDFLLADSGEKRLAPWLLQNMQPDGTVSPGCSMTELAKRLNLGRTSLYRELNRLEDAGIIQHSGKTITVLEPDALARK